MRAAVALARVALVVLEQVVLLTVLVVMAVMARQPVLWGQALAVVPLLEALPEAVAAEETHSQLAVVVPLATQRLRRAAETGTLVR